jgi:hypothetical protein
MIHDDLFKCKHIPAVFLFVTCQEMGKKKGKKFITPSSSLNEKLAVTLGVFFFYSFLGALSIKNLIS